MEKYTKSGSYPAYDKWQTRKQYNLRMTHTREFMQRMKRIERKDYILENSFLDEEEYNNYQIYSTIYILYYCLKNSQNLYFLIFVAFLFNIPLPKLFQ
jgi:hypothetical protein